MISKYAKKIKLKSDLYAVFNSYVIEPIFLNKENSQKLLNGDLSSFTEDDITYLKEIGIIITDETIDKLIVQTVLDAYKNNLENKITIMYIIPTNVCNLQCKYCFIGKLNEKRENLDINTAKHAIDLFAIHLKKINEIGEIFFYGAEPLMNFELIKEIVTYSKEKKYNIKFSMVSNGLLITNDIADFIKNNNISIGISIDGPKKITDKNRIFKNTDSGVYDNLIEKIMFLKKKGVDFGLSITIAPSFLDSQEEFIEWLKKVDVKNISYNLLHFTYKNEEWKEYYKKAVKFLYKSNNELFKLGFNEDRINRKYNSFYNKQFKFSDCGAVGANQITICTDGSLEICHGYWNNKEHKLPNINVLHDLDELFDNNYYNEWKTYLPMFNKKCLNCPYIYICGGGCAMQSRDVFGNEKEIDRAFCIYTKELMKKILLEIYEDSISENK